LFAVALAEQEFDAVQVAVSFVRYRAHVRAERGQAGHVIRAHLVVNAVARREPIVRVMLVSKLITRTSGVRSAAV